jgi:hypothetical protein
MLFYPIVSNNEIIPEDIPIPGDSLQNLVGSAPQWEHVTLSILSFLQEYGILYAFMGVLFCLGLRLLFKIKKNPKMQQRFMLFSMGCAFLWVMFTFAPYIIMHYLQ